MPFQFEQINPETVIIKVLPPDGLQWLNNLHYVFNNLLTRWEWDSRRGGYRIALWDIWVVRYGLQALSLDHLVVLDETLAKTVCDLESHIGTTGIPSLSFLKPLRNFQWESIAFALPRKGCLITHDRGLGKTVCGIGAAYAKMVMQGVDHALCVVPSSVKHKWAKEIQAFIGAPYNSTVVVEGSPDERRALWDEEAKFHIVNSELLVRDLKGLLQRWKWKRNLLIVDEHHRYKNVVRYTDGKKMRVSRTKAIRRVMKASNGGVIALTGHDIHKLEHWFEMMKAVNSNVFGAQGEFDKKFLIIDNRFGRNIAGYRNKWLFSQKLQPIMFRKSKAEVLPELPPKTYEIREVELTATERSNYRKLVKGELELSDTDRSIQVNFPNALTKLLYLRRLLVCPTLVSNELKPEVSSKFRELKHILEEPDGSAKIVIFSQWEQVVQKVVSFLGDSNCHIITGNIKDSAQAVADRFMRDQSKRYLVIDTAGGEAIDIHGYMDDQNQWQPGADMIIFMDEHLDPGTNEQVADRLHRFIPDDEAIRKWHVTVIKIRAANTIDTKIAEKLEHNTQLAEHIKQGTCTMEDLEHLV